MDAREKKLIIERGNVGKEGFRSMMGETGRMDETGDGRNKRPRVHVHSGDRNRNESKKGWLVRESRWEPIRNRKDGKNGENARSCKKRRREKEREVGHVGGKVEGETAIWVRASKLWDGEGGG